MLAPRLRFQGPWYRPRTAARRATVVFLASAACWPCAAGVPSNLYEWMATAPVVVVGPVVVNDERYVEFEATTVLRGPVPPAGRIAVDVRAANRERAPGQERLDPPLGRSYLLLLEPADVKRKAGPPVFLLVRGVAGAREVPAEGAPAFLRTARRLIAIQDTKDDARVWREFATMLEDPDPLLVETALGMYEKFVRAGREDLATLRPLLDHPRPAIRAGAARVIGQVARVRGPLPAEEATAVVGELASRARRDSSIEVRVSCTSALASFPGATVDELLREIAREDPEQLVRFEAQKSVYERSGGEASRPRPD